MEKKQEKVSVPEDWRVISLIVVFVIFIIAVYGHHWIVILIAAAYMIWAISTVPEEDEECDCEDTLTEKQEKQLNCEHVFTLYTRTSDHVLMCECTKCGVNGKRYGEAS